ncbi:MAG TPA: cytochrome C oxidase subunit IV family protein [Luteibaculaceae bacterium]|jgi:cytochrome c oxidase subunit IV|nr:cytochrome C oxidase subunit IV family protein [Luteibaculaceae bacterium]
MERDDIIEYSLNTHHNEEQGKAIRSKIWKVTAILTIITIAEVAVGIYFNRRVLGAESGAWVSIKLAYIFLTLVKAGYIVMSFMHLGDERKNVRYTILAPYILFVCYLIFIALQESEYINAMLRTYTE